MPKWDERKPLERCAVGKRALMGPLYGEWAAGAEVEARRWKEAIRRGEAHLGQGVGGEDRS